MGPLALWVREVLAPVSGLAGLMVAGEALLGSVAGPLLKRLQRLPLPRWVLMYTLVLLLGLVSLVAGNDPVLVVALPLAVRAGLLLGFDECSSAALLVLSVNVASAASPLGNPQNMIVAAVYGAGFRFFVSCLLAWALLGLLLLAPYTALLSRLGSPAGRVDVDAAAGSGCARRVGPAGQAAELITAAAA